VFLKTTIILTIVSLCLLNGKEVSVFGAGDINSKNPYGLNSTQKQVLNNKKNIKDILIDINHLKNSVQKSNEDLEGLRSVIEDNSNRLNDPNQINAKQKNSLLIQENKDSLETIKSVIKQLLNEQAKIAITQDKILEKIQQNEDLKKENNGKTVVKNDKKVTKKSDKKDAQKDSKKSKSKQSNTQTIKANSKSFTQAKTLYKKEYYTKAIPMFELFVEEKYKPSESNFYLGQMWFKRTKYNKAIEFYKKSATLHDKGWWMPQLLLNSAISFEKLNDLDNSATFYSTLIDLYPNSNEAKIAKKNINK